MPNRKLPRGIRNNNPGNIREAPGDRTEWVGERATDDDAAFEEFVSPEHGIRALAKILLVYQNKYRIRTVDGIIKRWAPPSENDSRSYANAVARALGVHPEAQIDVSAYPTMRGLVIAIIRFENGVQPYSPAVIDKGLRLAGINPPPRRKPPPVLKSLHRTQPAPFWSRVFSWLMKRRTP